MGEGRKGERRIRERRKELRKKGDRGKGESRGATHDRQRDQHLVSRRT